MDDTPARDALSPEDQWFDDGWSRSLDWQDFEVADRLSLPLPPHVPIEPPAHGPAAPVRVAARGGRLARARHERECQRQDEDRAEFWCRVADELRRTQPG